MKRFSPIRGPADAPQRTVPEQDAPSAKLLQQATVCRGGMHGFIAEVIEDHVREQVVQGEASRAAEELIAIVPVDLT